MPMKVYKGTDKEMKCRGFQYEQGKTAETSAAKLCEKGFHACEAPLDVFAYYPPATSRYFEANMEDVSGERRDDDTKVVGRKITLGAELNVAGLCKAHFEYVKAHTTMEHTDPKIATAGDSGAATAGYRGAATAGYRGAATSRGSVSVGENGCGLVRGNGVKVKGGLGAVLVICEENADDFNIKEWRAFIVDGTDIKADTWYCLVDGEVKEWEGCRE